MKKFEDVPTKIKCNWFKTEQSLNDVICKWFGKDGYCMQEPGPERCPTSGLEIAEVSPQK